MRQVHIACAVGLALLASPLFAGQSAAPQVDRSSTADARWAAWLGCWTPVQRARPDQDVRVCVTSTADGTGVRMITFSGDQRILDEPVVADGSPRRLTGDTCQGETRSYWSTDAERVFTSALVTCPGKAPQRTSGLSAMTADGQWLDIQVTEVEGQERVRVKQYVRAAGAPPASLAEELRAVTSPFVHPGPVTADDVAEAHRMVGARTVETWLTEADARVPLDKRALIRLADGGVPEPVIDLLVALAYPKHFEVRRRTSSSFLGGLFGPDDVGFWSAAEYAFDPYAFYYSPFGPSFFAGSSLAYLPYAGYVTIPANGSGTVETNSGGRAVNGRGYTQVEPRAPVGVQRNGSGSGFDSAGDSSSGSSGSGSGDSGGGGGSVSSSGYSGGGGGDGGTAVPR